MRFYSKAESFLVAAMTLGVMAGGSVFAQTQGAAPANPSPTPMPAQQAPGNGNFRRPLSNFDRYLDNHPEVRQQLNHNPSLVNNQQFLSQHPHLQNFLTTHPGVAKAASSNPQRLMGAERRFNQRGGDVTRAEAGRFDNQYLDHHPGVARQLSQHPGLVDNKQYMASHPQLAGYLKSHPEVRKDIKEHPKAFMNRERQYQKHEPQGGDRRPRG